MIREKLPTLAMGALVVAGVVGFLLGVFLVFGTLFSFGPPGASRNPFVWLSNLGCWAAPLIALASAMEGVFALRRGVTRKDLRLLILPAAWLAYMALLWLTSTLVCADDFACRVF